MMTLERVVAALEPTDVLGRAPVELRDLAYDTRALTPGSLFFCVPGAHVDGHDLAAEAVARRAVARVVERTMDEYFDAKRRLFVESRPPAAINVGDVYGRRLADELPDALTFGDGGELGAEVLAGIDLKLHGRFNIENALGAFAAGRLLGIDDDSIVRGLESVRGVPGRFESIDEGQPFAVIVDYAHTPDALANVLRAARGLGEGRVICVFGAGGDRDREKRPQMGRAVSESADVAIVTSDNPRSEDPRAIIDEVLAGTSGEVEVEPDRTAAIARAVELARDGDVVVIAGKGHEPGQQFADRTLPFDDRQAARDALRKART